MLGVLLTLGTGLILTPLLQHYAFSMVLVMAVGLYGATLLGVAQGKALIGLLLTIGLTLIPAAGLVSYGLAVDLILALITGIVIAVICQWLVYPFFPESSPLAAEAAEAAVISDPQQSRWIALRTVLIVLPPVMAAFTNPALYLATIVKTTLLAQQGSRLSAKAAGYELIGSTFLAGCFAILLWFGLKLWPSLWMFFLWMLLLGVYIAAKLYGVVASKYEPSYWQNVIVTVVILLGPAVEDSANGKDVYQAFAVRFMLFIAVTLYAWLAIWVLEYCRSRLHARRLSRAGEG